MQAPALFYHCYLVNNWKEIVASQLARVIASGLYSAADRLFIGMIGEDAACDALAKMVTDYPRFERVAFERNEYEYPTLRMARAFSQVQTNPILYVHTKGVTSGESDWRRALDYWTITRWRDCLAKLAEGHEFVGPYLRSRMGTLFSAGNFWWVTAEYLRRCHPLADVVPAMPLRSETDRPWRLLAELFAGTGKPKAYDCSKLPGAALYRKGPWDRDPEWQQWLESLDLIPEYVTAHAKLRAALVPV